MSRVALAQMASTGILEENLKQAEQYLKMAKKDKAEMVVLPENWLTLGFKEGEAFSFREPFGEGPIQQQLSAWAKQLEIWIVAGTLPLSIPASKKVTASCLVYDDLGEIKARYDKIHLFDVSVSEEESYQESQCIQGGQTITVFDSPIGRIGLSVCYDLRFPELFRALLEKGAEVLMVPSAFTVPTGKLHWEILNRVRAVENLCYVVAVNQVGKRYNGSGTYGHSMVVDPWGEIVGELQDQPGLLFADINLNYLHQIRERFPAVQHRKLRGEE
ncbi:MAG: carbon-nitrogen hydrolase family protein [Gammaproteobacteria bacterium]